MDKKKTLRIRATFNIEKNLYELLKISSQVEKKPMSRIIDNLLRNHVSQYQGILDEITKRKVKEE